MNEMTLLGKLSQFPLSFTFKSGATPPPIYVAIKLLKYEAKNVDQNTLSVPPQLVQRFFRKLCW